MRIVNFRNMQFSRAIYSQISISVQLLIGNTDILTRMYPCIIDIPQPDADSSDPTGRTRPEKRKSAPWPALSPHRDAHRQCRHQNQIRQWSPARLPTERHCVPGPHFSTIVPLRIESSVSARSNALPDRMPACRGRQSLPGSYAQYQCAPEERETGRTKSLFRQAQHDYGILATGKQQRKFLHSAATSA